MQFNSLDYFAFLITCLDVTDGNPHFFGRDDDLSDYHELIAKRLMEPLTGGLARE